MKIHYNFRLRVNVQILGRLHWDQFVFGLLHGMLSLNQENVSCCNDNGNKIQGGENHI